MICFAWGGFPQYAARLVGAFAQSTSERVVVAGKRPAVPVEGMEKYTKCELKWVSPDECVDLKDLFGEYPRALLVTGWGYRAFNGFRDQVRRAGGKVYAMVDNNFQPSFRELVKRIRFRLLLQDKYDGFIVPGKSGRQLLRYYGVPDGRIAEGLYAADASLFTAGVPAGQRSKKLLYVGQFVERKNVLNLCTAFARAVLEDERCRGWELDLYGNGPLKVELESLAKGAQAGLVERAARINVNGFVQPERLAGLYRQARLFCLPSYSEHWGLVVHEAVLSGCQLLLSKTIGAADDLLSVGGNGFSFDPKSLNSMKTALVRAMSQSDAQMEAGSALSLKISSNASFKKFVQGVNALVG